MQFRFIIRFRVVINAQLRERCGEKLRGVCPPGLQLCLFPKHPLYPIITGMFWRPATSFVRDARDVSKLNRQIAVALGRFADMAPKEFWTLEYMVPAYADTVEKGRE